jgi:dihydroorotate dehydrogenase electron transfer subunit
MMKAVARYAREKGIACEVSLENLMACGLGACLCCVEKVKKECKDVDDSPVAEASATNVCVCKEGPVFNIERLLWQN